jgi:PKHD-type hydroxylase
VLSSKFCDDVIKLALAQKKKLGLTFGVDPSKKVSKKDKLNLKKYRDSNIVWLNEPWIYETIMPYVRSANTNANWNFEIDQAEQAQFTIYKKNQYYHWHRDTSIDPFDCPKDPKLHGKIRKLSITVTLNDPKKYGGGDFVIMNEDPKNCLKFKKHTVKEINEKGSIVIFPSFLYHAVEPVKQGTRYSLVIWFLGKPWK